MLLVNAKAGASQIHGTGLIAQEFIPQGTKVWAFRDGFDVLISKQLLTELPLASRAQALYWSFFHIESQMYVMSSDDDRFTNHSDSPNTQVFGDCTRAIRDIHPGEEITNDYEELQFLDYRPQLEMGANDPARREKLHVRIAANSSPTCGDDSAHQDTGHRLEFELGRVQNQTVQPSRGASPNNGGAGGGVRVGHCKHGRGVFATRAFSEGEEILRFDGPVVSLVQALERGEHQANVLQIGPELYVDIGEPAVLVNHHCDPNAGLLNDSLLIALRPIRDGEEICYDYSTTMWEDIWTMPCHCGSGICRGLISDFPTLPISTQERYLKRGVVQGFIQRRLASAE